MKIRHLFLMLTAALLFAACNPDCENYESVSAIVTPIAENQLLVNTFSEFLKERELYADVNGTKLESTYDATMTGRIVMIKDEDIPQSFRFFVKDTDCGGFVPLNATFQCDAFENITIEVSPKFGSPGEQVIVRTSPPELLKNKKLFINKTNASEPTPLSSEFNEEMGGAIVNLPEDMDGGNLDIMVENNFCGGFANLRSSAVVADAAFIAANRSLFITPAPPQITIPRIQVNPPPAIIRNWFSPQDRDYCIWFVPAKIDTTITANGALIINESSELMPGDPELYPLGDVYGGSREISARRVNENMDKVCDIVNTDASRAEGEYSDLLHLNSVSGWVDKKTGYVNFTIDRTLKGLGKEQFEGTLIEVESIPEAYQMAGEPCGTNDGKKIIMMVVTSKQTGRQLILYRLKND